MKVSFYNFYIKMNSDTLLYNSLTGAMALVDNQFLKVIDDIESGLFNVRNYDSNLIEDMKRSGCILDDDINEFDALNNIRLKKKFDSTSLSLTITPTMDCNFRCIYCFENHDKGVLSPGVQSDILKFIESKSDGITKLHIVWFGGEPMLKRDIIYGLSDKIVSLCKKKGIEYSAFIVSNGSIFSKDDAMMFKKYLIKGIQITIDGTPDMHNVRRPFVEGKASFEHIINNVNLMIKSKIPVVIRMNLDIINSSNVFQFVSLLKEVLHCTNLVTLSFAKVMPFNDVCGSIEGKCLSNFDFIKVKLKAIEYAMHLGFVNSKNIIYPKLKALYCTAECENSFVIDVNGNIYKCWNEVGICSQSCGNVKYGVEKDNYTYKKWLDWNPLDFKECQQCKLLPLCAGGCCHMAYEKNRNSPKPICFAEYDGFKDILLFFYRILKGDGIYANQRIDEGN